MKEPRHSLPDFDLIPADEKAFIDRSISEANLVNLKERIGAEKFAQLEEVRAVYEGLQAPKYQYRYMYLMKEIAGFQDEESLEDALNGKSEVATSITPFQAFSKYWDAFLAPPRELLQMLVRAEGQPILASAFSSGESIAPSGMEHLLSASVLADEGSSIVVLTARGDLAREIERIRKAANKDCYAVLGIYNRDEPEATDWNFAQAAVFVKKKSGLYVAELALKAKEGMLWKYTVIAK